MKRSRLLFEVLLLVLVIVLATLAWRNRRARTHAPAPPPAEVSPTAPARVNSFIRERAAQEPPALPTARPTATPVPTRPVFDLSPTRPETDPEPVSSLPAVMLLRVVEADGSPAVGEVAVFSVDCGFTLTVRDGEALHLLPPGRCSFRAQVNDAGVLQRTEPVESLFQAGETNVVTLVLPLPTPGRSGLSLLLREGYAEISAVEPGSPAEQVGLAAGDGVLEVEGYAVGRLDADSLAELLAGPPGTVLRLLVAIRNPAGEFEEHRVEIVRTR